MKNNINCIILCAGSGSRMKDDTKNKVCFQINGKPAVVRIIENLKACGVEKFILVVGNKSESVMKETADIKGVTFAYQKQQSGTGNAAMCGLNIINDFGVDGPVLTVMGDKVIDKSVFKALIDDFYSKDSDISMITQPAEFNKSGGKIVLSGNKVNAIIEHMDVLLLKVKEELSKGKDLESIYKELNLTDREIGKINDKLNSETETGKECYIEINEKKYSSVEILSSNLVNCATYLHKRDALNNSIKNLDSNNAQNEIYFTDTIKQVAKYGYVSYVVVQDKKMIQTFNTMEELKAINESFMEE